MQGMEMNRDEEIVKCIQALARGRVSGRIRSSTLAQSQMIWKKQITQKANQTAQGSQEKKQQKNSAVETELIVFGLLREF